MKTKCPIVCRTPVGLAVLAVLFLPATARAQHGHSWEFNVMPFVQRVSISDLPNVTNGGLALHVGLNLPECLSRSLMFTPYVGAATDDDIGAEVDGDVAFWSLDTGLQLSTRGNWRGIAGVGRVARAITNTAETRTGSTLLNYSGGGFTVGVGARAALPWHSRIELSTSLTRGRFDNLQTENLMTLAHSDYNPIDKKYSVLRFAVGVSF